MAEEQAKSPENSMENTVILQNVFRHYVTTFDSVKTLRLVCKTWKTASDLHWRTFTRKQVIYDPNNQNLEKEGITISQFLEHRGINPISKLAPRNLLLDGWTIYESVDDPFWTLYGRNITILSLRNCTIPRNTDNLFGASFWTAVPNLEQLYLIDCKMKQGVATARSRDSRPDETSVMHNGIKVLHLQNVTELEIEKQPIPVSFFYGNLVKILPNLKTLSLSFQSYEKPDPLFHPCANLPNDRIINLKCVDSIEMYASASEFGTREELSLQWSRLALHKLTLDCGFRSKRNFTENVLDSQSTTLQELHLLRAPFSEPYDRFPCRNSMEKLTELRLWGNVCGDLNFLLLMPNLRVLKWNTSCYNKKSHGARLHKKLETVKAHPQFVSNIVEKSDQLGDSFKMESMQSLEMYSGAVSLECIKMLGKWMPNIKKLKIVVVGDEEFAQIGKQWPQLENVELAHGSFVTACGILESLLSYGSLKLLSSFTWKPCPCIKTTFGQEESIADNELRRKAGRNVVLPWRRTTMKNTCSTICFQALFEKALVAGGASVSEFFSHFPKQLQAGDCTVDDFWEYFLERRDLD